jgi:hypothetical protein
MSRNTAAPITCSVHAPSHKVIRISLGRTSETFQSVDQASGSRFSGTTKGGDETLSTGVSRRLRHDGEQLSHLLLVCRGEVIADILEDRLGVPRNAASGETYQNPVRQILSTVHPGTTDRVDSDDMRRGYSAMRKVGR